MKKFSLKRILPGINLALMENNLLQEFRNNVKKELDLCDAIDTPLVCSNVKTPQGYLLIRDMVIERVLAQKITISEAIVQIETELDPYSYTN